MYQSSTRKNFLDILADPTTIAILASIALHASIGAILPFFTQPNQEAKKAGPSTVKVVQLTPSELQRIPQAPQVPKPQVLPSAKPTAPIRPAATPPNTKFSTAPQTIPFSPQRPSDGTIFKAPTPTKPQTAVPQKQPIVPDFDPENIFKPKKSTTKPTPKVSPPVKQPIVKRTKPTPTPDPDTATDDNGGDNPPTADPSPNSQQAQQPPATPQPTPTTTPTPQPSGTPTGNNGGGYVQLALAKEIEYRKKYPGLVVYLPRKLVRPYPSGTLCPKVEQPLIVYYMVAFDKVPDNPDNNILGDITAESLPDASVFTNDSTPEGIKLGTLAKDFAISEAKKSERDRPAQDKSKRVLYSYNVQFDPTTCKK
jgi:hypothetical protein